MKSADRLGLARDDPRKRRLFSADEFPWEEQATIGMDGAHELPDYRFETSAQRTSGPPLSLRELIRRNLRQQLRDQLVAGFVGVRVVAFQQRGGVCDPSAR